MRGPMSLVFVDSVKNFPARVSVIDNGRHILTVVSYPRLENTPPPGQTKRLIPPLVITTRNKSARPRTGRRRCDRRHTRRGLDDATRSGHLVH